MSIAFSFRLPYLGVSPFTLLYLPLNLIRVSSLQLTYLLQPSVDLSLTHFLGEFPGLGLALKGLSDVVVPESEHACCRDAYESDISFQISVLAGV